MGTIKRTLKDHNFYIGIAVGVFVVPRIMGGMGSAKVKVNVPKSS